MLSSATTIERTRLVGLLLTVPVIILSFALFTGLQSILSSLLGCAMLAIALSDARSFIVPDRISLPMIPLGLLAASLTASTVDPNMAVLHHSAAALVAGIAFYALSRGFLLFRGHEGLGLGDVKLAAVAGAWAGAEGVTFVVLLASLGAIAFVLFLRLFDGQAIDRRTMIPFGAFLAPAIWVVWSVLQINPH